MAVVADFRSPVWDGHELAVLNRFDVLRD